MENSAIERETLTWDGFGEASRTIARAIVADGFVPEVVVAIARGGLLPAGSIAYGNDVNRHVDAFRPYAEAGIDVVHISQMGGRFDRTSTDGFFEFYRDRVLPRLRELP